MLYGSIAYSSGVGETSYFTFDSVDEFSDEESEGEEFYSESLARTSCVGEPLPTPLHTASPSAGTGCGRGRQRRGSRLHPRHPLAEHNVLVYVLQANASIRVRAARAQPALTGHTPKATSTTRRAAHGVLLRVQSLSRHPPPAQHSSAYTVALHHRRGRGGGHGSARRERRGAGVCRRTEQLGARARRGRPLRLARRLISDAGGSVVALHCGA